VAPAGRCEEGVSCFPFSIPLRPPQENPTTPLYETYHGMNVNVQYGVAAELDRSLVRGGALATVCYARAALARSSGLTTRAGAD
jgi:hypothetical protein